MTKKIFEILNEILSNRLRKTHSYLILSQALFSIRESFLHVSSFFYNETIFSRKRFLSPFVVKQRSCVLMIVWKIFFWFFFSCFQPFTHSMTVSRSWCSFLKWNETCSKSVFIQCFNYCWLLIRVEKMISSILFDVSDERIDTRYFSIRCNKVEIFFLIFPMTLSASFLIMMNKKSVNSDAWIDESSELAMF